jgi:hypothetical protein
MIGGIIEGFTTDLKVVTFKVREVQSQSVCYVQAEMSLHAQYLIDEGSDIWWHGDKVYIRFDEIEDLPFRKIGNSSAGCPTCGERKVDGKYCSNSFHL